MPLEFLKGEDLLTDTLIYLGVILVAFGLGQRWELYLDENPFAIFFYGAALFAVYAYWVLKPHQANR